MYDYSGTAFLRKLFVFVLRAHLFLAEVAVLERKMLANSRKMFGKKYIFSLQTGIRDVVAKNKTTFFVRVAVKIEKSINLASSILQKGFDGIARRL